MNETRAGVTESRAAGTEWVAANLLLASNAEQFDVGTIKVRGPLGSIAGCADIDLRTPCMHNWSSNPFVEPPVCTHHAIRFNYTEIRCRNH